MNRRHAALWFFTLAGLLLGGCAQRMSPMPGSSVAPASAGACQAGAPKLDAPYNRSYLVNGRRYEPLTTALGYDRRGTASWYGWESGSVTSMGTPFLPQAYSAASRELPLPTCVRVTNLANGRSIEVLVNDRGPFVDGRILDLSYGAARALDMIRSGTAVVRVEALAPTTQASSAAAPNPGAGRPAEFYLQTGAFQQINLAIRERHRLQAMGVGPLLIVPGLVRGTTFYRVQIGPWTDRSVAETLRARLLQAGTAEVLVVQQ
ncbi:SPOR domain-containing protein [Acidithiobacillus sp.]|uniref:SPOR domain-containing protein n=1 Tax=Acidithiobacillus sp. TaxID=1872118 RepID=UPI0025C10D4A|nr:SPOR domain-containing protein [Acidithiobacillus sp.]